MTLSNDLLILFLVSAWSSDVRSTRRVRQVIEQSLDATTCCDISLPSFSHATRILPSLYLFSGKELWLRYHIQSFHSNWKHYECHFYYKKCIHKLFCLELQREDDELRYGLNHDALSHSTKKIDSFNPSCLS